MHQMALGTRLILIIAENADLITDRCIAGTSATHTAGDVIRKGDGREVGPLLNIVSLLGVLAEME